MTQRTAESFSWRDVTRGAPRKKGRVTKWLISIIDIGHYQITHNTSGVITQSNCLRQTAIREQQRLFFFFF
jgi:hypothetical protein